jgi:hypothetical protein
MPARTREAESLTKAVEQNLTSESNLRYLSNSIHAERLRTGGATIYMTRTLRPANTKTPLARPPPIPRHLLVPRPDTPSLAELPQSCS